MKRLTICIVLLWQIASAQVGPIASRRYAELLPTQYVFGPLTALAPFNAAPNHTTATDSQVQPSTLISDNNVFASTGDFTTIANTASASFSVASNVGTISTTVGGAEYVISSTASTFSLPQIFVQLQITQNGATSSGVFVGISDASGTHKIMAGYNDSGSCYVWTYVSGTFTNAFSNTSCTRPSAPYYIGLSIVGSEGCLWQKTATTWINLGCGNTSGSYDPSTIGNLTGFKTAIRLSGATTTWKLANLKTGAFGAVGVRDPSIVTYSDGRPFMQGSTAYLTITSCDPAGICYDGVYSYEVLSSTLTQIGMIFNNRSGHYYRDHASHLVYDPGTDGYRYMVGNWATTSSAVTFYGAWSRGTFDPLAGQSQAVSTSQLTLDPTLPSWDAHFACDRWNYSTNACSHWIVPFSRQNNFNNADYSAVDPSSNTWTSIGGVGTTYAEGDRVFRTATGNTGVLYQFGYASATAGSASGGRENTTFPVRSSSSFASSGTLTAQVAGGAINPPHPQIFSYGNTEYLIQFNDVLWNRTGNTMGNLFVSTAPKYSTQPILPSFVLGASAFTSGSAASVSTSAISVTSGDLVIGYCRGGTTSVASVVFSGSVSMGSFSSPGFNMISTGSGTGYGQAFYVFATAGGSSTFTCTPNVSSSFQGVTVQVYHPGSLTTADYTAVANQTGSSNRVYTSPSFSTTGAGLIIVCADGLFGATNFVPGFIGPYGAGPSTGLSSGAAMCMSTVTPAAQSSITANVGSTSGNSAQWGGAILSFK